MIFIASDHGGYELKNKIVNYLDDGLNYSRAMITPILLIL
jgi:ribose 5-phosphate isomerase RpiB